MSSLPEQLDLYLSNSIRPQQFASELENTVLELRQHQEDILSSLKPYPEFLFRSQKLVWVQACRDFECAADDIAESLLTNQAPNESVEALISYYQKVQQGSLALRDIAWMAQGPSSHAGLNELLHLIGEHDSASTEESEQLLLAKLDIENTRIEAQAANLGNLPDFASESLEESLGRYQEILGDIHRLLEGSESLTPLISLLEEIGRDYTFQDVEFVREYYSEQPTELPCLNFALNAQLRRLDKLASSELVFYAAEQALETIDSSCEMFLSSHNLDETELSSYKDALEQICQEVELIADIEDKAELQAFGQELSSILARLLEIQTRFEDQGSRFDEASG